MKPTNSQLQRITANLQEIAGQPIEVESYDDAIWVFGSELSILRLAHRYRNCTNADSGFSHSFNTHYFKLE